MTPAETNDLKAFLLAASQHGYGDDSAVKHRESDGSNTITYAEGAWRLHDNYFTSEDGRRFYGREVIFKDDKPYWFLGYAGFVEGEAVPGEVYDFLKKALLSPDEDMPIRGPLVFTDGDWEYVLHGDETLAQFSGAEWIKHDGVNAYTCFLHGGLIN